MKTMLITGGARGIGAHMVRYFTERGWNVVFCYRNSMKPAMTLKSETGADAFQCDVRNEEQVKEFVRYALKHYKHIDALVINAGVAGMCPLEAMDTDYYDVVVDTNLRGAFLSLREAMPYLRETKGNVVMISSMWGVVGASCEAVYAASKAALQNLARSLGKEMGPSGVRVNCVAPGAVLTDMMGSYKQEDIDALVEETPLGRLATCEDIARAVDFLLSDNAACITGQTLVVDGGFTL